MPSSPADVCHLLRRVGFGGRPEEIGALTPLDWPQVVDRVLDVSRNPAPGEGVPDLDPSRQWYARYVDMTHFWFERARTVPSPIQEKLVLFWHGLLCSSLDKVGDHRMMFDQNQLFRTHGMGDVVDLFQAMALQPAMLRYLDGDRNVKGAANENFSRELMELFTLGVGHYTQEDVVASARAWTGHNVVDGAYAWRPDRHDDGPKTFFGQTKDWDGPEIITEILTGSKRDIAARYLAGRLWSFLAYPGPDAGLVAELGQALIAGGMRTDALLRAILLHPEFRSARARGALVRSPIEYAVAALHHTGQPCSTANPQWWLEGMGQEAYYPPNVSGWRQNGYWVSATALWAKAAFAGHLRWTCIEAGLLADSGDRTPTEAVDAALALFGIDAPSERTRQSLIAHVQEERRVRGWAERAGLLLLPLLTPEFQLA